MDHDGVLFKILIFAEFITSQTVLFSNNFCSSRLLNFSNTILNQERRPLKNKQL